MDFVSSLKKFSLILFLLAIATFALVSLFDQLIVPQIKPETWLAQTGRILIVLVFGSIIIIFIRRSKPLISKHVGAHPATVFQFFMILIVSIMIIFAVLHTFQVSPTTLLVGGGVVSIVIGLVISTFVGNILAGTLLLMTRPFRVGDSVLINNVPGTIVEITSMVTRIRNDIGGQLVIPNTAIVQGSVIVTKIPPHETVSHEGRLPYSLGDRVYTTYMSGEGTVKELTPFYTKILLDSGRELSFLNTSVLAGSVAIAKISPEVEKALKFSFKTNGDAQKTIEAIKNAAKSDPSTFKSVPTVLYASLEGNTVELEVNCTVDATKKAEAKSKVLEIAYLSNSSTLHYRDRKHSATDG